MNRRAFVRGAGLLAASPFFNRLGRAAGLGFPVVRPAVGQRHFQSRAVEAAIAEFGRQVPDAELGWLFGNCLPNALDTNVAPGQRDGRPDTFVGAGDSDAMWLRDASAQLWPYLAFIKQDAPLRQLVAGVIYRQARCILQDPYASAFYNDPTKVGKWQHDYTAMQPGVHERKWAIDSLCHPIRLAYHYWKTTGDEQPFDDHWRRAIALTVQTFREQQRKTGPGPYHFQRATADATDTQPLGGYGYPVRPVGLIASAFRPSGDATLLPFLVASNFFAVASLRQAALMLNDIHHNGAAYQDLMALADEVATALRAHAILTHPVHGRVYAYEVNGYGGHALLDDACVPSLLSLPYLGAIPLNDPVYQNTRRLLLSPDNPFFYKGKAAEGIGSPHTGADLIWLASIVMRGPACRHSKLRMPAPATCPSSFTKTTLTSTPALGWQELLRCVASFYGSYIKSGCRY
jgi:meiotically up-regulated gene 157 (Mug157) protein